MFCFTRHRVLAVVAVLAIGAASAASGETLRLRQVSSSFRLLSGSWVGASDATSVGDFSSALVVDVALAAPLVGGPIGQLVIGVRDREGLREVPYRLWLKANASATPVLLIEETAPRSGARRDYAPRLRGLRAAAGATIHLEDLSVAVTDPARELNILTLKDPTTTFVIPFARAYRFPSQGSARAKTPAGGEVLYAAQRPYQAGANTDAFRLLGRVSLIDGASLDWELESQYREGTSSGRTDPPSLAFGHHEPLELVLQAPGRNAATTVSVSVYLGEALADGFPRQVVLPSGGAPLRLPLRGLEPSAGRDFPTGADDYDLQVLVTIGGRTYSLAGLRQGLQALTNPVPNGVSFPY